jgi:riboflavin biosynthesis pyrimidine reductase
MALQANRTLVKSPPELWELADDPELQARWCAALLGTREPVPVAVTARATEERIAWRSTAPGPATTVELTFAEKGFGTKVAISVASEREPDEETLEALLDELGSPQRRPFARA